MPPLLVLALISAYAVLLGSRDGSTVDELSGDIRTLGMVCLATMLLSTLTMVVIGRSIIDPVDEIKRSALEVANERLPLLVDALSTPGATVPTFEPLINDQHDELGELVDALNAIQDRVVEIASLQQSVVHEGVSDLVVNLARRNQSLLDRQLELIDHLEHDEEDPERLEELFGLDHLATRMRRNAESLLVLAGAESTRRRGRPVQVADSIRVAMSEIENYQHVNLTDVEGAEIASNTALDLAHLLSELMENATQFSPPDRPVEVRGSSQPDGGYIVAVIDRGIGLSPEALTDANATLALPPDLGLGMSRSLGFIVVGHLARRLSASVALTPTPGGGTTATVLLSSEHFTNVVTGESQPLAQPTTPEIPTAVPQSAAVAADEPWISPVEATQVEARPVESMPIMEPPPASEPAPHQEPAPMLAADSGPIDDPLSMFRETNHHLPADQFSPAEPVFFDTPEPAPEAAPPAFEAPAPDFSQPAFETPRPAPSDYPAKLSEAVPDGDAFDVGMESLLSPAPPSHTSTGLVKRDRTKSQAPVDEGRPAAPSERSPEEIRSMLARYREGLKGRALSDIASDQPITPSPNQPMNNDQDGGRA